MCVLITRTLDLTQLVPAVCGHDQSVSDADSYPSCSRHSCKRHDSRGDDLRARGVDTGEKESEKGSGNSEREKERGREIKRES